MGYKKVIPAFLLLFIHTLLYAQQSFQYAFDHDQEIGNTVFKSISPVAGGGFVIAGTTGHTGWIASDSSGETVNYTNDIVLLKTDEEFNVVWSRVYYSVIDFTYEEAGVTVKQKPDGGFMLLAEVNDPFNIYYNGRPACLISTDVYGNILWSRSFSASSGYDKPFDFLIDNADTSVVVVGTTDFNGNKRPWVFKVNSKGVLVWGNTYLTTTGELRSIVKSSQQGYVVAGRRNNDVMVMNLSAAGTNIWTRTYSTAATEYAQSITGIGSGYAIMVNNTTSGSMQLQFIDSAGISQGARSFNNISGSALLKNGNQFIVVASQNGESAVVFRTNGSGQIISVVIKFQIDAGTIIPSSALVSGNYLDVAGSYQEQGFIIRQNSATSEAGGCHSDPVSFSSQAHSFIVSTIAPAVTNLAMPAEAEALFASEAINVNQYIICSCPDVIAEIEPAVIAPYCIGDSVKLTATYNEGYTYQWIKDDIELNATGDHIYASEVGQYSVIVKGVCSEETSPAIEAVEEQYPVVYSFSPDSAAYGDTITIIGVNLSAVDSVFFGNAGSVIIQNDTLIYAIVPADAASTAFTVKTAGGCIAFSPAPIAILPNPVLSVGMYIEGFYIPSLSSTTDTVTAELHALMPPHELIFERKGVLNPQGDVDFDIPAHYEGQSFFIAVSHRNSLETWFKDPFVITPLLRVVLYD